MIRLRQLWADHILAQVGEQRPDKQTNIAPLPVELTSVAAVHAMLDKFITESASQFAAEDCATRKIKKLGRGSGSSDGIAPGGEVLKRDTRGRSTALYEDRCDLELGGLWKRGDARDTISRCSWATGRLSSTTP